MDKFWQDVQSGVFVTEESHFGRPGRHSLTEDDILDIQTEFGLPIPREALVEAFADGEHSGLLHLGREWGWDDTEAREQLAVLLDVVDKF